MSPSRIVPILFGVVRHTVGLLVIGLFLVPSSRAQQDYLLQLGTPPGSPTMQIPMGVLNLKNGNVHMEFPLQTLVQRNGLKIEPKLIYDSANCYWMYSATECQSGWREVYSPLAYGTTPFPPYVQTSGNYIQCPSGGPQGGTWYTQQTWSGFSFTDASGTGHGFDISFNNTELVCTNNPNIPITASAYTLDGYYMLVTLTSPYGTPTWSVWDKHGNAIGVGKDANGNILSSNDELGRSYMPGAMPPGGVGSQQWEGSTIQWESIPIHSNFDNIYDPDLSGVTLSTISSITLPDGRTYQFTYDQGTTPGNYGQIIGMTLPTGGQVNFTYTNISPTNFDGPDRRLASLSEGGATWNFSYNITYNPHSPPSSPSATTVTAPSDPAGVQNQSVYSFTAMGLGPNGTTPWSAKYYIGAATGTPLREIDMVLDSTGTLAQQQTTILENGMSSKLVWQYQSNNSNIPGSSNITSKQEYDFSGNLVRETTATYQTSTAYTSLNITDLPLTVKVYGAGGAASGPLMAQTNYAYDSTALSTGSGSAGNSVMGSTGHDDTNYGSGHTTRGNLTSVSQMVSPGNFITTKTNYYNILGEVTQTTDGRANSVYYDYTDKWASGTSSCVPGVTFSYPTKITYPSTVTDTNVTTYSACDGTVYSVQDQNDLNAGRTGTIYTYDGLQRVINVAYPDGGSTQTSYGGTAIPQIITTTTAITASVPMISSSTLDGLGRTVQTELNSDPDGPTYTVTTYDNLGRPYQVYSPTRCATPTTNCGENTWGITTTFYDALSRPCLVVPPDGTLPTSTPCQSQPNNTMLTAYSGNCTTATDQTGKSRKSCSDALGRLTQVFEDPGSSPHLNYETDYSYDALDNLLCVAQNNAGGFTTCNSLPSSWRPRTFAYDSLSRLTSATNPESGTATYSYDANGNLLQKTSPAPNQTGSTTVTLSYCYDTLNRPTGKAYTAQTCSNNLLPSPLVSYFYDQSSYSGLTIANGVGRRTGMTDQAGSAASSYDPMGRPLTVQRTSNGLTKSFLYTYNLDGSQYQMTYPGQSSPVTYTQLGAGRPVQLLSGGGTYITANVHYAPNGDLCYRQDDWDGSWTTTKTFNNRFQPATIQSVQQFSGSAPPVCGISQIYSGGCCTSILDLSYSFTDASSHNNGNVQRINNNLNMERTQVFTYDSLNRLATAETISDNQPWYQGDNPFLNCWGEQYTYDPWGNLSAISAVSSAYTGCGQENLSMTPTTKNQLQDTNNDVVYDAAGNVTQPGPTGGPYVYDAENHLTSAGGVTYTYDGDGNRVMKSNGTIYWYGANSASLMETDLSGNTLRWYYFFNGQRVARQLTTNETGFYMTDHLGNVRYLGGSATGYSIDYYPFGGIIVNSDTGDDRYQFTGKERDPESNLDNFGARFDSSQWGRFMSPDPENAGASAGDPQSWNAYAYVLNNPLNYVDPNGLDCIYINNDTGQQEGFNRGDCDNSTEDKANSGYYVDGTVDSSSIRTIDNWITYVYKPDGSTIGGQSNTIGGQCWGDCPNSATIVNVPLNAPLPLPAVPSRGDRINTWVEKHIAPTFAVISAFTGLDPSYNYCGPVTGEQGPEGADHPKEQTKADEDLNNMKEVKDSSPKRPGPAPERNPNGSANAQAAGAVSEVPGLVNNGLRCIANMRAQQH